MQEDVQRIVRHTCCKNVIRNGHELQESYHFQKFSKGQINFGHVGNTKAALDTWSPLTNSTYIFLSLIPLISRFSQIRFKEGWVYLYLWKHVIFRLKTEHPSVNLYDPFLNDVSLLSLKVRGKRTCLQWRRPWIASSRELHHLSSTRGLYRTISEVVHELQ